MAEVGGRARVREAAGAAVQYGLLFGFAAVAAAISAHGLVGFARANMGLAGPWPYLLWGALDGAAGLCAVLLMRRAARGESALAPRVAVWGLVAASSVFNWTHAPPRPGAREAFALMPVVAAVLFEFSLRETRHTARSAERRLTGVGWLRPAERVRVQARLSADPDLDAGEAARRVRVELAARRLNALRLALAACEGTGKTVAGAGRRVRRAERRARVALARARFADPAVAADVLRQVQVLALTSALARLDYTSAAGARALLASLITAPGQDHVSAGTGTAAIRTAGADGLGAVGGGPGAAEPGLPVPASPGVVSRPVPGPEVGRDPSPAAARPERPESQVGNGQAMPQVNGSGGGSDGLGAFPALGRLAGLDDRRRGGGADGRPVGHGGGLAAVNGCPVRPGGLAGVNGRPAWPDGRGRGGRALVEAAVRMVAQAREDGVGLSQAALARRLRAQGFHIANERLRWLSQVSGLDDGPGRG